MSAWSHLPNAAHIDRILESLRDNPDRWSADPGTYWDVAWDDAYGAAYDAAWDVAWDDARDAAYDAAWDARGAILALIAWERSADLLQLTPEAVRVLAALGDDASILLLPAVTALECETAET